MKQTNDMLRSPKIWKRPEPEEPPETQVPVHESIETEKADEEDVPVWQPEAVQDSEMPYQGYDFIEKFPVEKGRSRKSRKKWTGLLLGVAAGVVFLGIAVQFGTSFLKNQEESSGALSGAAGETARVVDDEREISGVGTKRNN